MVTGIETAGLVLAALPIVVQVLTEYRSGLRKTLFILGKRSKTYESKIGKLARQLKILQTNLHQVLTRVIGTVAPDEWSGDIPRDYRSLIWTGEVGKKIKTHFEEVDALDTFEMIIEDFEEYLLEVAKSLSGLLAVPLEDTRDLRALIDAHSQTGGHFRFQGKIEFLMKESQIVTVVEELKHLSVSLESLVGNSNDIHHMKQLKASSKQSGYASSLYAVQRHAHSLFRALRSSWDQTCHPCHEALLCLEDRCAPHSSRIKAAGTSASLTFTALFQKDTRSDLVFSWHRTQVSMVENHQSEILFPAARTTLINKQSAQRPMIELSIGENSITTSDGHVQIGDMCRVLLEIRPQALLVSADSRIFRSANHCTTPSLQADQSHDTVELSQFLFQRPKLSPVDKLSFGLSIASSLLQLNLTPWICKCWTKDDIILRHEKNADSGYDMAHPLIRGKFEEITTCQRSDDNPDVALLELGILLVELWTETTLESWVESTRQGTLDLGDLALRRGLLYDWWCQLNQKAPPTYSQVVQTCCFPFGFGNVDKSWDNIQFKALYYTNIVEPLSADLEKLRQMQ